MDPTRKTDEILDQMDTRSLEELKEDNRKLRRELVAEYAHRQDYNKQIAELEQRKQELCDKIDLLQGEVKELKPNCLGIHDLGKLIDAFEQMEGKPSAYRDQYFDASHQAPWGCGDDSLFVAIENRDRFCKIIDGDGGHNRYQLRADGFVYFSERHSNRKEKTELAKELGFRFCNRKLARDSD